MTDRTTSLARRARPGLWAAALFVVLAGLFGMHGLGDHGTPGMDQVDGSMTHPGGLHPVAGHHGRPMAGAHTAMTVLSTPGAKPSLAPVGPGGRAGMAGMAGMCLALLTGVLLALLLARGRAVRALAEEPRRRLAKRRPRGRDPDPPALASLSILRC